MKQIWHEWTRSGVFPPTSPSFAKRIILANQIALFFVAVCLVFSAVWFFVGDWRKIAFNLLSALPFAAVPWLNKRQHYLLSRLLILLPVNFTVFFLAGGGSDPIGSHALFTLAIVPFLLFGSHEKKAIFFMVLLPVGLFEILLSYDFVLPTSRIVQASPPIVRHTNSLLSFALTILSIRFLLGVTEEAEKRLASMNKKIGENQRFLRSILDHLPGPFFAKDPQGRYLAVNPEFEQFTGKKAAEIEGKRDTEIFTDPLGGFLTRFDEEILASGKPRHFEHAVEGKGHFYSVVKFPVFASDEAGKIAAVCSIATDVTAQVNAQREAEQERSRAAHSAKMASLGEMAGSLAHELNSPLTTVKLQAEQLSGYLMDQGMEAWARRNTDTIVKTADRMAAIIRGVRAFSRDAEADPMEWTPLHQIIDDTLVLCRGKLGSNRIAFKVSPIPKTIQLHCRPVQISQILVNLLNNAFDAVSGLDLQTERWIRLELELEAKRIQLRLANGGPPIPPPVRDKLFRPFFTTKPAGRGTGLGLSTSLRIAEDHGGTLTLESDLPNTCFVVGLPLA